MRFVYLHDLLCSLEIAYPSSLVNSKIRDISCNSNEIKKGTLFLGLPGLKVDGGIYWQDAIRNGAEAAIISQEAYESTGKIASRKLLVLKKSLENTFGEIIAEFWERPSRKLKLIGVTGTNGKTTATFLLEYLLNKLDKKTALLGTIFNRWNGFFEISSHTTSFADKLQSRLFSALESDVEYAILEVSSHAIAQKRIVGCEFKAVVFTNLSQDHLDYHHDMESYFQTKSKLFKLPYYDAKKGISIINGDDKWCKRLLSELNGKSSIISIKKEKSDLAFRNFYYVTNKTFTVDGTYFDFHINEEKVNFFVPLIGEFNLMNAIQAVAILYEFGFSLRDLSHAIASFPGVPGRMERIIIPASNHKASLPHVIVDYAHTPDGLENVLKSIRKLSKGKLITVFGCGGDRDKTKRALMGSISERLSDLSFITSDNPRSEDPQSIVNDILTGIRDMKKVAIFIDRFMAIKNAINIASANDIVLLAGKGHEDYQILRDKTIDFDDRKIAKDLLIEKNKL